MRFLTLLHRYSFFWLLACCWVCQFISSSSLHAQPFEKQMDAARREIERKYGCECLTCLPAVAKTMQGSKDDKVIARGYRDISVLLWYCNDRFSNGYANSLTAKGALRYSLMFRSTPEAMAMLDSMHKAQNDLYFAKDVQEWNKLDSPWQGNTLAKAPGGSAYFLEAGEAEGKLIALKTDTGWISTSLSAEGWDKSGTLEFLRDGSGRPAALLVEYGENSYGSGGGTTWNTAFVLDVRTLQSVYTQGTRYEVEVFCGKYGEDPDCVRTPCAIEHTLSVKDNKLVIGKVRRAQYQQGESCSLGGITLSFLNYYGEVPDGFKALNIPVEYTLPGPPPGAYQFEKGKLVR